MTKLHEPSKALGEVFFALCKSVNSPRSLACWILYKNREFQQLVDLSINADDYFDAYSFDKDYQVTEFLSKTQELRTGTNVKEEAIRRFKLAEDACALTNKRLRSPAAQNWAHDSRIYRVMRKIAEILGDVPSLDELRGLAKWGNGATATISRRRASCATKQSEVPSVTFTALPLAKAMVDGDFHWFEAVTGHRPCGDFSVLDSFFKIVPGNVVTFVKKSAKTDRSIGKEPTMNGYIQQAIGRYIRKRLKRVGVDLNHQEINQTWASLALALGLATVDLKMASDTIARYVVLTLLPPRWYALLDSVRSKAYSFEGSADVHYYEKFSSMGNAYTFELESLIFYAMAKVITEETRYHAGVVSIYGDDIIVPNSVVADFVDFASYMGFSTNEEKTHADGSFYESCGKHYYGATEVTPAYQKKKLVGPEPVRLHNRLVRKSIRSCFGLARDELYRGAISACRRSITGKLAKCLIPAGSEADDGLLVFNDESPGAFVPGMGWKCSVYRLRKVSRDTDGKGRLAHCLRHRGSTSPSSVVDDEVSIYSKIAGRRHGTLWVPLEQEVTDEIDVISIKSRRVVASRDFELEWA